MIDVNADEESLLRISEFHGHLGPYVVVGFRMGLVANRLLGDDPFAKSAIVLTGGKTPQSCVVDGVQLSSGCTLGKGNIAVIDHGKVAAIFTSKENGEIVKVTLREEISNRITSSAPERLEVLAEELYSVPDEQMFEIS